MDKEVSKVEEQQIYIVISQTGTVLSKILKLITGAEYNHASISLDADLRTMYSFGRKFTYNPFWGAFVKESPDWGTFKRFEGTRVVVLEIKVNAVNYYAMKRYLELMYINKGCYHYNYLGLFLAAWKICYKQKNHYYCSEFVKDILVKFRIAESELFDEITIPEQFLSLFKGHVTYCGELKKYETRNLYEESGSCGRY